MARRGTVSVRPRRLPAGGRRPRAKAQPQHGPESPHPSIYPNAVYCFTLEVLGYPVNVFSVKEFNAPNTMGESTQDVTEPYEIYLLEKLPSATAEADTMLHEVLHIVNSVCLGQEAALTEPQINMLATVLVDTVRRNPALKQYLLERV